jgi:hypothetical protein
LANIFFFCVCFGQSLNENLYESEKQKFKLIVGNAVQIKLLEDLMHVLGDVVTEVSSHVVREAGDALNALVVTCNTGFRIKHMLAYHKMQEGELEQQQWELELEHVNFSLWAMFFNWQLVMCSIQNAR